MRLFRREPPLWAVRVAFIGPAYETEQGILGSGECRLTVRAKDAVAARRQGVESARDALAQFCPGPPQFWSIISIDQAEAECKPEFNLYEKSALPTTDALMGLLEDLSGDDLRLEVSKSAIRVVSEMPDRFNVTIEFEELEYRVSTAGWHGHLSDPDQAISCFQWLLTPFYRVGKDYQNGELAASWIERYDGEAWETLHPVLYRNPSDPTQWMGEWTREYWQQNARPLDVPFDDIVPDAWLDRRGFPKGTVLGRRDIPFDDSMAKIAGWLESSYSFDPGRSDPPLGIE